MQPVADGAISEPLRLHLGCRFEWKEKYGTKQTNPFVYKRKKGYSSSKMSRQSGCVGES